LSTRKTQNSILAIATLGVYLGLLLAGAPGVLAQAATAKQFDVKDETGRRDDLDKKPDEGRSPVTASIQIYLEDVEYFLSSLGRLQTRGKFDFSKDTFDVVETTLLPCVDSNLAGRYSPVTFNSTSEASRSAIEYFSRGMVYGYSLGDCVPTNEFKGQTAVDNKFDFHFDGKAFWSNVAVRKDSPQRAADLHRELTDTLALFAAGSKSALRSEIVKNTILHADNDQVSIVTRLPRGSLDTLLASNAK
jgi:hypothetical protein